MKKDSLLRVAKEFGFESIDDFVRANLHYLPGEKQKFFRYLTNVYDGKSDYCKGGGYG